MPHLIVLLDFPTPAVLRMAPRRSLQRLCRGSSDKARADQRFPVLLHCGLFPQLKQTPSNVDLENRHRFFASLVGAFPAVTRATVVIIARTIISSTLLMILVMPIR